MNADTDTLKADRRHAAGLFAFCRERMTDFFRKKEVADIPLGEAEYVVLDTEMTGLDLKKDSLISIGAVRMKGGAIDLGDTFYRVINPPTEIAHESIVVHGITPSDVAEMPSIDAVLGEFLDFCGKSVIVGHFISLDISFLNRELKRVRGTVLSNHSVDTCRIYEWMKVQGSSAGSFYERKSDQLNLFSLAREFGVPVSEGHNALSDAFITAQLFQRFLSLLTGHGVRNISDLLRVGCS